MLEYSIQRFSPACYPLMQVLFRAAFNTVLDEKSFAKKYNTKELGHEVIGFLALHTPTQTPAAFYGVFPVKILLHNKQLLGAQSGDTMTHPLHQKKGLFVQLAERTYDACREAGIQLVFGQPNKNSYHGLVNRLGFTHLDNLDRYDLKLSPKTLPLPKLLKKVGLFAAYLRYAKTIMRSRTVTDIQAFNNPLQTNYGKILRNHAYLLYKHEDDKLFIQFGGIVFWLKLTDVLWIGDVSDYKNFTPAVVKELKRLAFFLGYNTIRFQWNKSLQPPSFLEHFRQGDSEPSCFLYLDKTLEGQNIILTGADFDTW